MKKIFIVLYILVMALYLSVLSLGWREWNAKTGYFLAAFWLTLYAMRVLKLNKELP